MRKVIDITITVLLLILLYLVWNIVTKEEKKEEYRLLAVKQGSGKVRYYKQMYDEKIQIDKITLDELINKYDVVLQVEGD